jgi:hypothetical protein
VVIFDNLQTPGFGPSTGDRFSFSTRTTAAGEDVSIDNLSVTTTGVPPLATNGPVIWEFLARNNDNIEDDDFDHPDWIELYNGQVATQSLNGWFLTNDPLNLQKWAFPTTASMAGNAYTYVFASGKNRTNAAHFHTSFTLAGEGGWIGLVRPNGTIAHQVTYGQQYDDIPSGFKSIVDNLNYLSAPTPGKPNTVIPNTTLTVTRGTGVVTEKPVFTTTAGAPLASGFIGSNQSVTIQPPALPGAVIRGYSEQDQERGPGDVGDDDLVVVVRPFAAPAPAGAIASRIELTSRHTPRQLLDMATGRLAENLFCREWLLRRPPREHVGR